MHLGRFLVQYTHQCGINRQRGNTVRTIPHLPLSPGKGISNAAVLCAPASASLLLEEPPGHLQVPSEVAVVDIFPGKTGC
jgi:hypothetical protein